MSESGVRQAADSTAKRYRFGLRWLLVVVLVFATLFAWIGRASFRVARQTQLLSDLAQLQVRVREWEPTGLALLALKLSDSNVPWLRERISEGWLKRPSVLVTWTTTDEQVPQIVQLIKPLYTVRELHLEESPVTDQGIAMLKSELPNVAILTRADLRSQVPARPTEHFAFAALEFLAIVGAGLLGIVVVLLWPVWRRR